MAKPINNSDALQILADNEGYKNVTNMLSIIMNQQNLYYNAICMNCGTADNMEPDQNKGYCNNCEKNEVKHAFVLAGII